MKTFYVIAGFFFLAIGMAGVVIPVLPTAPFLILTSICFAKGSDRFHTWFRSTSMYEKHLADFEKSRSMTLQTKIKILAVASVMLLIAFWRVNVIYARITIALVILFKYYYFIFRIKTIKEKQ
ncbi:YbaN family protein [Filifactor villosus]|uniref:YbaN family protein n=1 Tax=Filifactor villosus TaxID=29374 RepID=A0ABV9QKB8_9FIRM